MGTKELTCQMIDDGTEGDEMRKSAKLRKGFRNSHLLDKKQKISKNNSKKNYQFGHPHSSPVPNSRI